MRCVAVLTGSKHDGRRLRVGRSGKTGRLWTRTQRQLGRPLPMDRPRRAEEPRSALRRRWRGRCSRWDGVSDFKALHSRRHDEEVKLYALHSRARGEISVRSHFRCARPVWRGCCASVRTACSPLRSNPARLGLELFRAGCGMGFEGLVSKRRDRRYGPDGSEDGVKVKNPTHPAMTRSSVVL